MAKDKAAQSEEQAGQAAAEKAPKVQRAQYARQRAQFQALVAANPNYFGNLTESPFKAVLEIQSNTFYEELGCVGYNPNLSRLEAVVFVKQPGGYGGNICSPGSREYVRFFLSFDNGATWVDQGLTAFKVYDIPQGTLGARRLEYDASLTIDPRTRFCFMNNVVRMRAILSWNFAPPPGNPNFVPVWGEVQDAYIQLKPRRLFPIGDLFEAVEIKLPPVLKSILDLDQPIEATEAKALNALELQSLYKDKGVETHRFAFTELHQLVNSAAGASLIEGGLQQMLPGIDVNIDDLVANLFPTDGSTRYEELKCVGLNTNLDTLVGIIHIKRPSGYSGGPCTAGSKEYVTFWGDFNNNGTFETCLGTASVSVHDIANIPPQGLMVAVALPVDLKHYRKPCQQGPVVIPIRAILSWGVAPPCFNPNYVPTWGNREQTLVHITPGPEIPFGVVIPKIAALGNVPTGDIDDVTGLTTPAAVFADISVAVDNLGRACPFGGRVNVIGESYPGYSYRLEVQEVGALGWTTLMNNFNVVSSGGVSSLHSHDGTGKFDFLPVSQNMFNVLGQWDTSGDDLWRIRMLVYDNTNTLVAIGAYHRLQLDNTRPEAEISIDTGLGNCGKFIPGTLLSGRFVARDLYFKSYSLVVKPTLTPPGAVSPVPGSGVFQTAVSPGNIWTLDTTDMQPCGYIIEVHAYDRAVVSSGHSGHHREASAGFCLDEPIE